MLNGEFGTTKMSHRQCKKETKNYIITRCTRPTLKYFPQGGHFLIIVDFCNMKFEKFLYIIHMYLYVQAM